MFRSLFLLGAVGLISGCASVNSVSLTQIPANRSKVVQAQVSKTIFLAFSFDNDFIDSLVADLKHQCPGGVVSGILTKDETISYFIVFTKRVTATGFCSSAVASRSKANRSAASTEDDSEAKP
jgi:hypothetical protein